MKTKWLWGIGLLSVCGGTSACATTETARTVSSPIAERRTRLDPAVPVITSEWTLDGRTVNGTLRFSSCVTERDWTTTDERVVHRRPLRGIGWALLSAGSITETIGVLTHDYTVVPACPGYPDSLYEPCNMSKPDNTGSNIAIATGVIAAITGVVILAANSSDQPIVLKSEAHREVTNGSCILPRDLSMLSLLLQVGENRYLHVEVTENGTARVELPPALRLTPGSDLPVLVYHGPAPLADALPRLQVVGSVHVPE